MGEERSPYTYDKTMNLSATPVNRIDPEPMSKEMAEQAAAAAHFPPSSFHPSCAVEVKLRLSEEDAVSFYRILAQEWTYADIDSPEAEVFWRLLGAFEAAGVKGLVAKAQKSAGGHRLDE